MNVNTPSLSSVVNRLFCTESVWWGSYATTHSCWNSWDRWQLAI